MVERYVICRKFGAHVHLTAASKGVVGMKEYVDKVIADNPGLYWCPRQFENRDNPSIHYTATGPEIWAQAGGKVDYFIAGVGTGGTVAGVARFLKEKNPAAVVVAVEPSESRVHAGLPHGKHTVVGIGPGVTSGFLEELAPGRPFAPGPRGDVDEFLSASSEEAAAWADRLARAEGMLVGPSSGCAMKVAADVAARPEAAGKTVVVLFASSGVRYLAHPMWAAERAEAAAALPAAPSPDPEPLLKYTSPAASA
jgi:cysteine synthase